MEFASEKQGGKVVIAVTGRMDAVSAPDFEKECAAWQEKGENNLVIDLAKLEYISSAGLRSILAAAKKLKAAQGGICFYNLSGMVEEVFTLSGFSAMFPVCVTLEEALAQ